MSRMRLPNIFEEQIICRGGTASSSSRHETPRSSRAVFPSTTLNCYHSDAGSIAIVFK